MNATDQKFREGLEGHEVKPSDAVWERVEAGLPATEEKKAVVLWYRWAAAAAILLMFGLGWMSRDWSGEVPAQEQIAAKPTEELEEAKKGEATESTTEETQAETTPVEEGSSETTVEPVIPTTPKVVNSPTRAREQVISLPKATVNLASLDVQTIEDQPVDARKKFKIDLEFTAPPSKELIASAEPQKKSITEFVDDQWEALSGLKFKDLENPKGKVELPKIDRNALSLDNLFNRNKQQ
ncbi:anti-sigma factor [Cryomorphaceae bacterium]|nr:anti-sigma factor [Cryomorphaceae bacterium]